MLNSMTGYGRGSVQQDGRCFTVEIKSVNNRYLDINIKLPRQINALEENIRKYIVSKISRGKTDVYILQDRYSDDDVEVKVDEPLAKAYYIAYKELVEKFQLRDDITVSLLSKSPDVIQINKKDEDMEKVWETLKTAIDEALNMFVDMRQKEGLKLGNDIIDRCNIIASKISDIDKRSPEIIDEYRKKILLRVSEFLKDVAVDEARLLNEVAFFADKCSVTEELGRLNSHIIQMKENLNASEPVGRKLDFLIQEMNREINTIGSKSNDLYITNIVVDIKSELEKIREQIQNIE